MDDVLRCDGCGAAIELDDDAVTIGGRRFHAMCTSAHHGQPGSSSRSVRALSRWYNALGFGAKS